MMDWEDVRVQLIDTPPITADFLEGYLSSMVRAADAAVLVVDLGDDDGPFAAEAVIERLAEVKTMLVGQVPERSRTRRSTTAKRCSSPTSATCPVPPIGWRSSARCSARAFPIHVLDAETGQGLEEMRTAIYQFLNVIRVYSEEARQAGRHGVAVHVSRTAARCWRWPSTVHRDFADKLKSARIWGTGVFDGQTVTREHVLHDKDIVELHV